MLFCDLLRVTVLLVGGVATALGAVSVVVANQDANEFALDVRGRVVGSLAQRSASGSAARRARRTRSSRVLAGARTATSLPTESPGRIAIMRLWPIGAFAVLVGIAGWFAPQIAAIGAGYAILIALAWRGRERAVAAIEERDGVRFYVEPSSAWQPVKLVRTPGLYRDRAPAGKQPPPPPAEAG